LETGGSSGSAAVAAALRVRMAMEALAGLRRQLEPGGGRCGDGGGGRCDATQNKRRVSSEASSQKLSRHRRITHHLMFKFLYFFVFLSA
jgi:hypothetical protein